MKCQFGQCRRPIYHGMSAMWDIYPRTDKNDRKILFGRLGQGLVKLVGRFLYCILRLTSFGNVEIVSLLDMPTQCALYSVSVTLQQ